jgi:hypothetical protein
MNTAPNAPMQGEKPSWQLICVADDLDKLNADHAFLTALYELSASPESMEADLRRLLDAYLDTDPRQKLKDLSDQVMTIARSMPDRHGKNKNC